VTDAAKIPAVCAHEICFSFGEQKVIDHLDLVVDEGDFVGILGPNGGGKTTLIRLILGLIAPSCGEIRLFGTPVADFKDWHLVGYVPQAASFDRRFPVSVREVAAMGRTPHLGYWRGMGATDWALVDDALEKVGMAGQSHALIGELSGGQQQRVFIARALAAQPKLLLMDEPTAGVDLESNERFYGLLRELNRSGITIVLVSHDIGTITKNANKVACIAGRLLFHCPAPELTDERVKEIFAGSQIIHHHHEGR
jgi:zinc transport system ATP-binding protein